MSDLAKQSDFEIIKIDEISNIIKTAPDILTENQDSLKKAIDRGNQILENVEKTGMSVELSKIMADYLTKLKRTKESVMDKRKPFTQVVDRLKKHFTGIESQLSDTSEMYVKIKSMMDRFAKEQYDKQETERKEKEKILNKQKEIYDIIKDVQCYYGEHLSKHILAVKTEINAILNNATLETIGNVEIEVSKIKDNYSRVYFDSIIYTPKEFIYHTKDECLKIFNEKIIRNDIFTDHDNVYKDEIPLCKTNTIHQINSKKNELDEIEKQSDENKKILLKQQKDRELAEAERLKLEAEKLQKEKELVVETATFGKQSQAQISFNAEFYQEKVEVKQEYKINLLHKAGYIELFKFWFDKEASALTSEKIERMTIERMLAYAEKKAVDEKIVSEHLKYELLIKSK